MVVEFGELFHSHRASGGGCRPGPCPRPQDFQGIDGCSQRWFDDAEGRIHGVRGCALVVFSDIVGRIRSGYPSAGRFPTLPACVLPEEVMCS